MQKIINCIHCNQKLRIPTTQGIFEVKCPACKTTWEVSNNSSQKFDSSETTEEREFNNKYEQAYAEKEPNFEQNINVAVIGKVSAGKSSLINAILGREKSNPIAIVGAKSGVTTKITAYRLDEHVLFVDCPGLNDVREENSLETKKFLSSIDIGLFVVTGSADTSQKENFQDLQRSCKKVFVVLNKIDEWDDLEESAYHSIIDQWKSDLGTSKIYGTCTKGYDPEMRKNAPMDIRGVEELKSDLFSFLEGEGKAILLARHLKDKNSYALGIIATALAAVAVEAFIPGSAAYITATQVVAITSLHYLYTGGIMSKTSALSLIPTFAGQSIGTTAFLWAKSFLPPTGIVDVAAATVAATITFAMLSAVKWILENNYSLDQKDVVIEAFLRFKKIAKDLFKNISLDDLKNQKNLLVFLSKLVLNK
jgi:small GTP-binding protein